MEKKNKKMMIDEDLFRMLYQYLYTKSLIAGTDEERETSRIAYLNRKGIPENLRW